MKLNNILQIIYNKYYIIHHSPTLDTHTHAHAHGAILLFMGEHGLKQSILEGVIEWTLIQFFQG